MCIHVRLQCYKASVGHSYDLVNKQSGNMQSELGDCGHGIGRGEDKFKAMHPDTKGEMQLAYGQELGMGSREYELIEL